MRYVSLGNQPWVIAGLLLGTLIACGGGESSSSGPTLYERAEAIIETGCSSSYCHGGPGSGAASINFERVMNQGKPFSAALLSADGDTVPACEYDRMPLLTPGNANESWLMVKIETPHDASGQIEFTPASDWEPGIVADENGVYPPSACPMTSNGNIVFGSIMPYTVLGPDRLPSADIEIIRAWIDAGAPVPK